MFRKIVIRLVATFIILMLLAIGTIGTVVAMALMRPSDYATICEHDFSAAEQAEANEWFEDSVASTEQWLRESIGNQQLQNAAAPAEQRVIRVTQDRMNAWLSLSDGKNNDFERVRVRMLEDRIRVAGEVPGFGGVLSGDFRLAGNQDQLRLELLGAKVGRLPIPIASLLKMLPDDAVPSDEKMRVSLDSNPPHVLWKITDAPDLRPIIQSIHLGDEAIEISIQAPEVSR